MVEEVKIPEISENVSSGKIVSVLVKEGDMVDVDDVLVELETEKAVVEIPSTVKGKIKELFAEEGKEMQVGDVIARIDTEAGTGKKESREEKPPNDEKPAESEKAAEGEQKTEPDETAAQTSDEKIAKKQKAHDNGEAGASETGDADAKAPESPRKKGEGEDGAVEGGSLPASPSVRRFARELGVDIHAVQSTGIGDRITEADIKAHVKRHRKAGAQSLAGTAVQEPGGEAELPDFSRWGEIEKVELDTVRSITAKSTSTSWRNVPHVTQFDRADITDLQTFIQKNADKASAADGKLTVTPILIKVCAEALKRFPRFNASIDPANRRLILKKYVHVGVMVDTPRGLLVPVIRDADQKRIIELATEVVDIAERSRNKKIKPEEMEGGTFSISNQGGIGGTAFTPIVLWPQAAVLGISRASTEPKFVDGEFRPRRMLPLSLSYDHRIVDGADAAQFLRWVCECLEHPFTLVLD